MTSTAFDSFYFRDRFGTAAMRAIWEDRATLQRWLDVEAALAEAEAELGVIPAAAAGEIAGAARIDQLDLQSMKAAFRTVGAAKRAGRFIAVLGDMYELG